ncbi:hypothetical protein PTSG_11028 [Salpingoeca rosetta]|uniref:Aspartyl/asparaginy/proline hydroxylase domain-containing protein n=1 Tax=Salpingoeca rosetta (strain ATCC 50818 / BSB-021) TaxID=946362 RepID=F2USH4_SALR5|nr:uncharacterized protein PTSG_11028 [Salpingoeca rosetta]EGD81083.1 hypothetical protein PTSG_11028 [Salpingoeca rosetta]|eukprot:XP_004987952.1 hypothetical protein PTSG_11028 [Salpingoeca rosetta]
MEGAVQALEPVRAWLKTASEHVMEFVREKPVVSGVVGGAVALGFGYYMSLRPVYYDFNKICGQFNDKNLDVDPYFFDPSKFDWVPMVESNWKVIRQELEEYLDSQPLQPYFGGNLMSKKQCWRVLGLKFWGLNHSENQKHFPKTMAILNKVPGLSLVAFSQIEGGTAITPHHGDTNANIRCHMGLVVPGTLPEIGFQVGDQQKSWEEGKILMFCDAHRHTAFNNTDKTRIILQFDVIRPEFENQRTLISARVLASICTQKIMLHVLPCIRGHKIPLRAIYYTLIPFLFVPIITQIGSLWLFNFFLDNSSKKKDTKA